MIRYEFYGDIMCGGTCCINERFVLFKFSFLFSYLSREIRNCMNNPGKISSFNKTFYANHDCQSNSNYITTINIIKESVWNTCWNNSLWLHPKSQVLVVITNECMHRRISIYHIIIAFKLFSLCCYS